MKLINLCEYTLNQSRYDEGIYPNIGTAGERLDAQKLIDDLKKQEVK